MRERCAGGVWSVRKISSTGGIWEGQIYTALGIQGLLNRILGDVKLVFANFTPRLVSLGLGDDLVHLLNLSQGSLVGTQSLLRQLLGSLLASVSDQLNQSSLVWSQAGHLLDDVSDKGSSLGKSTLSVGDLGGDLLGLDLAALVNTNCNTRSSHFVCDEGEMGRVSLRVVLKIFRNCQVHGECVQPVGTGRARRRR